MHPSKRGQKTATRKSAESSGKQVRSDSPTQHRAESKDQIAGNLTQDPAQITSLHIIGMPSTDFIKHNFPFFFIMIFVCICSILKIAILTITSTTITIYHLQLSFIYINYIKIFCLFFSFSFTFIHSFIHNFSSASFFIFSNRIS